MRNLTAEEKAFVTGNIETLKPREMAAKLKISVDLVRNFMNQEKLVSICIKKQKVEFTAAQEKYIYDNAATKSKAEIAIATGIIYSRIANFIVKHNIPHKVSMHDVRKHTRLEPKDAITFERPAATYSNKSFHH